MGEGVGKLAAGNVAEERLLNSPLIKGVAREMGTLPWCILSSRSLAGFTSKGIMRTMNPPRMKRTMGAVSMTAPQASSRGARPGKQWRLPHTAAGSPVKWRR